MSPKISILHATAQPVTCEETAKLYRDRAEDPSRIEHIMVWERAFFAGKKHPKSPFDEHIVAAIDGTPVKAWNIAADIATSRIYAMIADDVYPSEHWDTEILQAIPNDLAESVVWITTVDDNGKHLWPEIITHPIVTSAYVKRYGYLLHPSYFARFSDLEFSDKARNDGVVIDCRGKIIWRHENHQIQGDWHPSSEKINSLHEHDNETYNQRSRAGFPKAWDEYCCPR